MANETLSAIAEDLVAIKQRITEGEQLIQFARDAGEDVTTLVSQLRTEKSKLARYEEALRKQGITI